MDQLDRARFTDSELIPTPEGVRETHFDETATASVSQTVAEVVAGPVVKPHLTLEEIRALPEMAGAYYVRGDLPDSWRFRFRILRELREDGSQALHPQITASDGQKRITLALSKHHGWHIQQHHGDIPFNRQVLRYLNKGKLSVNEDVFLTINRES